MDILIRSIESIQGGTMKKVLVIGGTGTLSSPVVKNLINEHEVYVLNRGNKAHLLPEGVHSIIGDYHDKEALAILLAPYEFDIVINFILYLPSHAHSDIQIFKGKVKQYIFISTVASLNHEISCNVDESMESGNKYSSYGQLKGQCEEIFMQAYKDFNFPLTIVRPTQTYSEDRIPLSIKGKTYWSVIDRMLEGKEVPVHGDGQSVWASTHAQDFANLFTVLVGRHDSIGQVYHIMNPESHTWDQVYHYLAEYLGVEYKPVYISKDILKRSKTYDFMTSVQGDKHFSNIFDVSKIMELNSGYEFQVSIKEGVKGFLDYMDANPDLKVKDLDFDSWCDRLIQSYQEAMDKVVV